MLYIALAIGISIITLLCTVNSHVYVLTNLCSLLSDNGNYLEYYCQHTGLVERSFKGIWLQSLLSTILIAKFFAFCLV